MSSLITERMPQVVVCYGKAFWSDYQKLFEGSIFKQEGQFQIAFLDDRPVILTVYFKARSMNTRFDDVVSINMNNYRK